MASLVQLNKANELTKEGWKYLEFPRDKNTPIGGHIYMGNSKRDIICVYADGSVSQMVIKEDE